MIEIISTGLQRNEALTRQREQRALTLVNEASHISWDVYPVRITPSEMATLDQEQVFAIMEGRNLCPTHLAGLAPHQVVCETLKRVDAIYYRAVEDYKQLLNTASIEDQKTAVKQLEIHKHSATKVAAAGAGGGGVLGGAAAAFFFGPLGIAIAIIAGAGAGGGAGAAAGKTLTTRTVERESSAHRIKWMGTIDDREKSRLKEVLNLIEQACEPLLGNLKSLEADGQTDANYFKQMQQLSLVYKAHFKERTLRVGETEIGPYLTSLASKFTALNNI